MTDRERIELLEKKVEFLGYALEQTLVGVNALAEVMIHMKEVTQTERS